MNATATAEQPEDAPDFIGAATYDPEDNKLRMRFAARLPKELYERVHHAGFTWAPRQELFVAPAWTPDRADLAAELCGDIGDEDTSLVDRAEERADRFEDYSEKRAADADSARRGVEAITSGIPLGQPILVGHHSEKHARKDAERIETGMRKAVKMWETSKYWVARAKGAINHAKYKELPAVRHRRIKGIEADKRKYEKEIAESEFFSKAWWRIEDPTSLTRKDGAPTTTTERALFIANRDHISRCFPLADYPRQPPASQYEGQMGLWGAITDGVITAEQARDIAIPSHVGRIARLGRWVAHCELRLEYERAMLGESGGLAAEKFNIVPGGRVLVGREWLVVKTVNRTAGRINSVSVFGGGWVRGIENVSDYRPPTEEAAAVAKAAKKLPPLVNYPSAGFKNVTKAEYDRSVKHQMGASRREPATAQYGAHRQRTMIHGGSLGGVFITDIKVVDRPPPGEEVDRSALAKQPAVRRAAPPPGAPAPDAAPFEAMRQTLKTGIKAIAVEQLFVTPPELAAIVVGRADVCGRTVLEPSAGLGALALEAERQGAMSVSCIEIAPACIQALRAHGLSVIAGDFLELPEATGEQFERIVMNPPFAKSADEAHIRHAYDHWLAPGGRLVAIAAANPSKAFRDFVEEHDGEIEKLPEDSFKASGTGVHAVLVTLEK